MPHFAIEYARSLEQTVDLDEVMQTAYEAGAQSGIMDPMDIKVRAIGFDHALLADDVNTFLHVTVSLLEGRTDNQKEKLALCLRDLLASRFPDIGSISIDVRDMNPVAYKKRLLTR